MFLRPGFLLTIVAFHFASACTLLFDAPPNADATDAGAVIDAAADATTAVEPDAGCELDNSIEAELLADAVLLGGESADLPRGDTDVMTVSSDLTSLALFRFSIGVVALEALRDGRLDSARLQLHHGEQSATECNAATSCGVCDDIEAGGLLAIHLARSDWVESEVTFHDRAAGVPWALPGAREEGTDRSPRLATSNFAPADGSVVAALDIEGLSESLYARDPFVIDNTLTVLVGPGDAMAKFVIAAREQATAGCDPPSQPASLIFEICRR